MIPKYPFFWLFILLEMISGSVTAQATDPVVADTLTTQMASGIILTADSVTKEAKPVNLVNPSGLSTDTVVVKPHSPRKATLYSMVLPGLGQIYNKKYWKVPVLYAGIGALTYMGIQNNREYKRWHEAYLYTINKETTPTDNDLVGKYDAEQLRSQSNYYRRNLELTYIFGSFLYILNMVDAAVDAHLFNYDISDDLSLHLLPQPMLSACQPAPFSPGSSPTMAFGITWQL